LRGSVRFQRGTDEVLSGYARVPDTDWIVVVQQPASSALASVWASRELTFIVLLAAFIVAASVGVTLADRLATPLALLARAAHQLATGATTSILPSSHIYEVRVVERAFAQMQARLAVRTVERERADARLRILAHASGELTRSLDEDAIIAALGKIIVEHLADWCAVDIIQTTPEQQRQIQRVLTRHRDPGKQALAARMSASFDTNTPLLLPPQGHPATTGKPLLLSVVTPRQLADMTATVEDRRAVNWLGMRSLIIVPLQARDQVLGTLTCVYGRGGRRYNAEDLSLVREVALRAALAIDNARLFAAEHAARDEAEAAVRMREEFLAIAAHELKTPMTSLRGFVELGVRSIDAHGTIDPVLARRTLETIGRQSGRLSALVANLLEVARGTSDRQAIAPRPINLVDVVRSVVDAARVRADQYVISLDTPDEVPVVADPLRIEQVLTNLVDNAVKYSPPGAAIDIRVCPAQDQVEVQVRDFGMGIPTEHRHRIFDRFIRAHVSDQASGMGLGLYISQEIMRRHGGLIRAVSPDDGGTLMIVTLPRTAEKPNTAEPAVPGGRRSA
jgi:K+-sensing histidine kinase KdpD